MSTYLTFWIKKDQKAETDYENLIPIFSISRNNELFDDLCNAVQCGYNERIKLEHTSLDEVLKDIDIQIKDAYNTLHVMKENMPNGCDYDTWTTIIQDVHEREEDIQNLYYRKGEILALQNVFEECSEYLFVTVG